MFVAACIVIILLLGVSARWNWWRLPSKGIPVLMYHKIGSAPQDSQLKKLWVAVRDFEKQLAYLARRGYTCITFRDIEEGKEIPEKAVIITFDDGYLNNYLNAVPVLKKAGWRAVFFIVTDTIAKQNEWHNPATEQQIPMMGIEEIRDLSAQGHEIGSHTCSHPNLVSIDHERLQHELTVSKKRLEDLLGRPVMTFSYPYGGGAFDKQVQAAVRNAGYLFACSIRQGLARLDDDHFCLKRLLIRGDDTLVDFHLNLTRGKSRF